MQNRSPLFVKTDNLLPTSFPGLPGPSSWASIRFRTTITEPYLHAPPAQRPRNAATRCPRGIIRTHRRRRISALLQNRSQNEDTTIQMAGWVELDVPPTPHPI
ncbi:unnamed protein product, partial [Ectocarpus sp. 12 AP-2014]